MEKETRITTTSKIDAIKSYINTWLKDERFYCNNCGEDWYAPIHMKESCCENPQFGRNIDHTKGLIIQNEQLRKDQLKDTGATETNTWRACLSLPPRLYSDLERFFGQYGEKLFNDEKEMRKFMKEFPQFCSCKKI